MSERLPTFDWKKLKCVFEQDGFTFKKRSGKGTSHWVGTKPGVARPLIVPEYDDIGPDIIRGNMRTATMSRERLIELARNC